MQVEIFDLDGTLWMPTDIPLCVSEARLSHPMWAKHSRDYSLLPNVADAIAQIHDQGATIVVATNQGGLPWNVEAGQKAAWKGEQFRPYKSWTHFQQEMSYLRDLLPQIDQIWCSPGKETGVLLVGHPDRWEFRLMPGVECHKPAPTMLLEIWRRYPGAAFRFWGDRCSDRQAAIAARGQGMPVEFEWVDKLTKKGG